MFGPLSASMAELGTRWWHKCCLSSKPALGSRPNHSITSGFYFPIYQERVMQQLSLNPKLVPSFSFFLVPSWHLLTGGSETAPTPPTLQHLLWHLLIATPCRGPAASRCSTPVSVSEREWASSFPTPSIMGFRRMTPSSDWQAARKIGPGTEQWLSLRTKAVRNITDLRKGWGPPQKAFLRIQAKKESSPQRR